MKLNLSWRVALSIFVISFSSGCAGREVLASNGQHSYACFQDCYKRYSSSEETVGRMQCVRECTANGYY